MKLPSSQIGQLQDSVMQEFILGSNAMRAILQLVNEVARYDVSVLITGESGTGKELLAKIIHLQSPRSASPFVPVNCGILSGLMFEDKLFGHEKGAFTGAISQEKGCFEIAEGGTLFLDEVSEIPLENQVDFLRVLEDFRFIRIGGSQVIQADLRVISATNKDLRGLVAREQFREDLFYRLHVVPIALPPLRERKSAIPLMVDHFLEQFAVTYKKPKPTFKSEVLDLFCRYDWPGNVRELKNLIERVLILCREEVVGIGHLPSDFTWHVKGQRDIVRLEEIRTEAETKAIADALYRLEGDKDRTAAALGISPRTLRYKLQRYRMAVDKRGNPLDRPA